MAAVPPISPREILAGHEALGKLVEAGLVEGDVTRVVIDIPAGDLMMVYVQRVGTERWFDVLVDALGKPAVVTDPAGLAAADQRRADERAAREARIREREARLSAADQRAAEARAARAARRVQAGGAPPAEMPVAPPPDD